MFSRYFLTFLLVALVAAVASASADNQVSEVEFDEAKYELEVRSKIGDKVLKILKSFFKHATEDCLKSAVDKCKKHWYNPSKVIQCAKDFFSIENIGCLVGAQTEYEPVEFELEYDEAEYAELEIEVRSKLGDKVLKILKSFFKHLTEDCLKSAVDKCKKHWYNPSKVIQCAKDFFSIENVGCLVGAQADNESTKLDLEFDEAEYAELEIEVRSKIGDKVLKILKSFFKHATEDCLKSAVNKCKKHWYNPSKVIQCAKDFFSIENVGCLVGA
ncbi:hypothetical protein TSAR_012481 [Trichomalopsis sarcophagae]|uniref:Saposin B-type domain-containing protein n=1 Tax=Trichomalopsis sarcophagae TaxID=543379 RepID=A0A232F2V7_9HYME|nr:hypothetical protein TSAR_012481 [Trichomalopsis sarcophagae]